MLIRIWEQYRVFFGAVLVIFPIVNFGLYAVIAGNIGGDAISGKVDGSRYYLGSHGQYTEVSRAVYTYSEYHTYVTIAAMLLFLLCGAILEIKSRREAAKKDTAA